MIPFDTEGKRSESEERVWLKGQYREAGRFPIPIPGTSK
jgi:hypothetical protein